MKLTHLLDNPTPTVAELAKKYHTASRAVETELTKGIKVEMEHTSNPAVAREIALDHLGEDLYYYDKLSKLEKGLKESVDQLAPVQDPTPAQLKLLARRNKYHSARFVIYKPDRDGHTHWIAADSEHFTHHSMAPAQGAWLVRGFVQYMGDGEYAYRSMEVYSPKTVHNPLLKIWQRAGIKDGNPAVVEEDQVPGTQFVTLNASQLKEALAYLEELAENIDGDSITYSDNTTIYNKLDKDYKAITAVEYVMKNNMKALKNPQLAQDSIFLYDIDDSDLSYIEFVGAIHVVVANKVAEVKWIGSYDANGAGLLRAAMQIAKERGALEMKLEAKWQSEGFYTKMGFEQAGATVDQPFSGSQLTPFKKKLAEKWSAKYKKSIDCGKPKGFSQRAHCAARKRRLKRQPTKCKPVNEHMVFTVLRPRQDFDLFYHTDRTLDDQVQFIEIDSNLNGFVIYKNQEIAAYLLLQEYQGNQWMLEAATIPKYRQQGLNSLLIDSAIKKHGRVFADMQLTPDSIHTLENYIKKTVYKVQRLDTENGDLHDYNPHDVTDQQLPMYDLHVPNVSRPADPNAVKWVWGFSLAKPRNPLLMGYITAIESYHRPNNTLSKHDKVQKLRESSAPYTAHNRAYDAWIRYTPDSLDSDWQEINCDNPKGFSQRAHCAGRKARSAHKKTKSASVSEHSLLDSANIPLMENISQQLQQWEKIDQQSRNEYQKFVQTEFDGDYDKARASWMKKKGTSEEDFFGTAAKEKQIHNQLMTMLPKIPFDTLSDNDWGNLWLITQHADHMPQLQKRILDKLKEYVHVGSNLDRVRYLTDRLLNNQGRSQKYFTQDQEWQQKLSPFQQRRWSHTQESITEATTRTSKVGAPGTLKAKISGKVTCDKVKRLKQRSNATPHDVSQANWFLNMHGCSESTQLTELFREPAKHADWKRYQQGPYTTWETEFSFMGKKVSVSLHTDTNQTGADFVARNRDVDLPNSYDGYAVLFHVNGSTDVTGEMGTAASKLFAQVVSVLKGFLSTHDWDYLLFIGEAGSRDKLYDALAHLLARQVGAQVATYRSDFLIYKPFPLLEVFDYKLSRDDWKVEQRPDGIDIEFKVGDDPYLLKIMGYKRTPGIFEVIFSRTGMSIDDDATGILNTGNAFQVFAAVAQLLQYATEKMRIKALYFTAKEPSRIKLYKALTTYFATKLGWKFTTDPQFIPYKSKEAQFLVYKPGFSITEQVQLQEVFDYKLEKNDWNVAERYNNYTKFEFSVEGEPYEMEVMQMRDHPQVYDVVFGHRRADNPIGITHTGAASKVFSSVAQLLAMAIKYHNMKGIYFTASEASRRKLYDALANLFAKKMGWQLITDPTLMPQQPGAKEKAYLIIDPTMMKNSSEHTHDVSTTKTPHLMEVFDFKLDKKDWEITTQGDNYTHYKFVLDGTLYYLYFVELRQKPGIYEVVLKHGTSGTPIGILGTGNAQKVFSSVAQLLRMAILQHHAQGISFTASEPSRKKLYDALSKLIAQTMGWKIITDPKLMPPHNSKEKPYLIMDPTMLEAAGVGLVVPGVNMPAGMHPDEIRRQAKKFGNQVSAQGVPPITDTSGKIPKIV